MPLRLLVLDAYAPEGRAALRDAGGTEAGLLYARLLRRLAPGAEVAIAHPADPDFALPSDAELAGWDGLVWTGSSLTIHHDDDPRVRVQVALARAAFRCGVPAFGSCWAAQLAVVAAGGRCAPSPRGREFGVARRIALSPEGREHPLYAGKPPVFDAFTSHADEVVALAPGARVLAENAWSRVQAVAVAHAGATFWAVQYHPEFDAHEVASLLRLRADELVAQGTFASAQAAREAVRDLEALHADPADAERRRRLGVDEALLDETTRTREVANWIASLPRADASPGGRVAT